MMETPPWPDFNILINSRGGKYYDRRVYNYEMILQSDNMHYNELKHK